MGKQTEQLVSICLKPRHKSYLEKLSEFYSKKYNKKIGHGVIIRALIDKQRYENIRKGISL